MASGELQNHVSGDVVAPAEILQEKESTSADSANQQSNINNPSAEIPKTDDDDGLQITCFTEDLHDVTFHFQIIRLKQQVAICLTNDRSNTEFDWKMATDLIYAWIGCNSAKFGHLYAAAPTRPNNMVSVTSILGGTSDNTGSSIARRLVLKTGLNIILACNIPKNSPMLEADAERKLVEKLTGLGYVRPKSQGLSLT